jgi:proline iminopeptidase
MKKVCFLNQVINAISVAFVCVVLISWSGSLNNKVKNPVLKVGHGHLAVHGGNIWYSISGAGKGIPVVLLHGGPGGSSFCLKPFEELGNDRQIIRYDQLGGGKSDAVTDTTMFTIKHFVLELDALRKSLKINKWNVLGHSWGTILAIEYYRAFPDRVASLTFASACFDIPAYANRAKQLLKTLPDSLQQAVYKAENSGNYQDPLYQTAINRFTELYLVRKPIQADIDSTLATYNYSIYNYMQGPSEFTITGTLKNYDATSYLSQIKVPALFTVGEFDEVGPELVKNFADKVQGSQYVVFPNSAHITMWDTRNENIKVIRDFLLSVD